MQAIILAAGMGRRLGEFTRNNTKCMVEVNGVRLIDRLLGQLARLDLSRVVIVVGYEGARLKEYLAGKYEQIKIEYVENPIYDKTNNIYSLWLAKKQLLEDDTLLIESDLIFEDSLFELILNCEDSNVALVDKYESWMDGTMVRLDDDRNIVNFIPKKAFKYSDIDTYYKTVNIYKFSREFSANIYMPFLEAYTRALGNNEYYEQVLRVITLIDSCDLKALPLNGQKWYEIDDVQDLRIAEAMFAEADEKLKKYQNSYGGYWRYPGMLDFCYLVNPYFPRPRMIEEIKANFEPLLRDYPSGMGVNSLLAGKYFSLKQEYVCVGNGAAELIKSLMGYVKGRVGVVYPTFEEYPNRYDKDRIVTFVPENSDFSYTADDLKQYFAEQELEALLLINPDNPSGNFISKADVLDMAVWCEQRGVRFIVDESFVDFADGYPDNSLLHNDILAAHPTMGVMKSISKSYGVPGLRLGVFATADKDLIGYMRGDVAIWNINSFAEFYMQIFGKYESDYRAACYRFIEERSRFYQELRKIDYIRVIPSQANYFLCEITARFTAHELTLQLLEKFNILIKDCSTKKGFAGRNYIRIAIRDRRDNDRLVEALNNL